MSAPVEWLMIATLIIILLGLAEVSEHRKTRPARPVQPSRLPSEGETVTH